MECNVEWTCYLATASVGNIEESVITKVRTFHFEWTGVNNHEFTVVQVVIDRLSIREARLDPVRNIAVTLFAVLDADGLSCAGDSWSVWVIVCPYVTDVRVHFFGHIGTSSLEETDTPV